MVQGWLCLLREMSMMTPVMSPDVSRLIGACHSHQPAMLESLAEAVSARQVLV